MPKVSLASVAVLAGRMLLLCLAAGALVFGFLVSRRPPRGLDPGGAYTCPMHPEVNSSAPGDCPICRMELELRKTARSASSGDSPDPNRFELPHGAEIQTFDEIGYGKMYEAFREMRAPAWAETRELSQALFYRDEIALIDPKEEAFFYPWNQPQQGSPASIKVKRLDEPPTRWDGATSLVRFRVDGKGELVPGQTGSVKLAARVRTIRAVRASAVIQSPTGPYVLLVAKDNRTLTRRPIEIGRVGSDHAAVLSGLEVGERIATLNTFFFDAERRFAGSTAQ